MTPIDGHSDGGAYWAVYPLPGAGVAAKLSLKSSVHASQ
jgi:hypothetical protein